MKNHFKITISTQVLYGPLEECTKKITKIYNLCNDKFKIVRFDYDFEKQKRIVKCINVKSELLSKTISELRTTHILAFPNSMVGCDGDITELEYEDGFTKSQFSWWADTPYEWHQLNNKTYEILEIIDQLYLYNDCAAKKIDIFKLAISLKFSLKLLERDMYEQPGLNVYSIIKVNEKKAKCYCSFDSDFGLYDSNIIYYKEPGSKCIVERDDYQLVIIHEFHDECLSYYKYDWKSKITGHILIEDGNYELYIPVKKEEQLKEVIEKWIDCSLIDIKYIEYDIDEFISTITEYLNQHGWYYIESKDEIESKFIEAFKNKCPRCYSRNTFNLVYKNNTSDIYRKYSEIALKNIIIFKEQKKVSKESKKDFICRNCGHEWRKGER